VSGMQLWRSDGTAAGTTKVQDIAAGGRNSNPSTFTVAGTSIFFVADDGTHGREWFVMSRSAVFPPVAAPQITSPLTAAGVVGVPFSYTISTSGSAPISFEAMPLPPGLALSGATISGTPAVAGTTQVALTATNAAGADTKTLVITIETSDNSRYDIYLPSMER
jgi:ELWxxDGT repeat protein